MEVRLHGTVDDFRDVAVPIYRRDPVSATVELMVLSDRMVDRNPAPLLATVWNGASAVGAAFQTLRSPLLCAGVPEPVVGTVVTELAERCPDLNGVHGPVGTTTAFAEGWCALTGSFATVRNNERLHRLDALLPPTSVAGSPRHADAADQNLINLWFNGFRAEALGLPVDADVDRRNVRTAKGPPDEIVLWTLDGMPVSMAGVRSPVADVSRIGPVYTPPDRRGQGYGAAVTAAATQWALSRGATDVVLFTDVTKPAVNAVYQRIGFRPVTDFLRIDFGRPR
ncbi:GNAT family N-acetyltransferase [Mycobacterium sp. 1274761.0]|uniref:GNAT family N-acetyltransferase n=1 Tax=Mycobacterium sp. 1274761.0 TaxID=1834077 RepID=UPI0007FC8BDB|nr:GNAT family N-acetyltransferase [Mycobacterium sp. 1274761.0]OBK70650.1 hypothetical protein A5651_20590 [Mycobacterium sp. 1274761.0]